MNLSFRLILGLATLAAVCDDSRDINALIRQLRNNDEFKRSEAAEALAELGPKAAPAVPELIKSLTSKEPLRPPFSGGRFTWWDHSPLAARQALVRIGPQAVPALEKALEDKDALTRVHAASALWEIKKQSKLALPVVLRAWKDRTHDKQDVCIRREATKTVGKIAQAEPDRLLKLILKALKDDAEMGYEVTVALTILGEKDKRAVEHLFKLMSSEGEHLYRFSAFGLRELKSAGIPMLIDGLKSESSELRWRCAWALGCMKSTYANPAVPALKRCLKDDTALVREWATWALKCIEKRSFDNRYD